MQKYIKKVFALFMTVVLLFGTVPGTVYAAETLPEPESMVSSEQPSEKLEEPEPVPSPETSSAPVKEASPNPSAEPSHSPSPTPETEEKSALDKELATLDTRRIWPALRSAKVRAAAGIGTAGVLQMGYYCFKSDVGTLTTLGEYVSQMPAKTMLVNGTNIQFEIINKSKNPVEVNGKKAAPDEVAVTITTNAQGVATTGPDKFVPIVDNKGKTWYGGNQDWYEDSGRKSNGWWPCSGKQYFVLYVQNR